MDVGISIVFQNPGRAQSDFEVYQNDLKLANLAEPLGFDAVWGIEHHFTDYTMMPDVMQFLAYMAGRTERVKLGSMAVMTTGNAPSRLLMMPPVLMRLAVAVTSGWAVAAATTASGSSSGRMGSRLALSR